MAVSTDNLIIPGRGTVFVSAKNAPLPANPLTAFTLTADKVNTNWRNIGHTSKENTISFEREGGDPEAKDTWIADGVRIVYSDVSWSVNVDALQIEGDNLDLAFNGGWDKTKNGYIVPADPDAMEVSLVVLAQDNTGKFLIYIPNASIALREAPNLNPTEFMALSLQGKMLPAAESAIPAVKGKPARFMMLKTGWTAPSD